MISRLLVENFKSLRLLDAELGRFMLIVGPNDSGKSSLLRALALTRSLAEMPAPELPASCLSHDATSGIMLRVENDCASRTWVVELGAAPDCIETGDEQGLAALDQLALYRLRHERLARPCLRSELGPRLGSAGEGLAVLLDTLSSTEPPRFEAIQAALRVMVPDLRGVRSLPCTAQAGAGDALLAHIVALDYAHTEGIPAHEASEGVMLLLGLLTLVEATPTPATVLIDDLDRGLDPASARRLLTHLRALSTARPELQIIATTRSPALAEQLAPAERLTMRRSPSGESCLAPAQPA